MVSNDGRDAFAAPPSTAAAALINNISAANKPSRPREQDELKTLMLEVSNAENNGIEFQDAEAQLSHKHKLIYVFSRSILERLTGDDPFIDATRVVSEAFEAMDVFITIFKETPGILNYVVDSDVVFQGRGQEPLWVWLFPRVLALLGRQHCDSLTEKIKDFFFVSFQAASRSPKLWELTSVFFCYLKDCASTALDPLQNPSIILHRKLTDLSLPSSAMTESYGPRDGLYYAISDAASALSHVTSVLSMLVDVSMVSAASHDATPAFQDYLAWMLDTFLAVHELQKRWKVNPEFQDVCKKSEIMLFCCVHALMSSLQAMLSDTISRKGYVLLSILTTDLLESPSALTDKPVQLSLFSSILALAAVCRKSDMLQRLVSLQLLPVLQATLGDESACGTLGSDFQKAARSLQLTCRSSEAENAHTEEDHTFESDQLNKDFRLLGLQSRKVVEEVDGPPLKRRKTNQHTGLLEEIITELCALLGSQRNGDLDGLKQIAEAGFIALDDISRCKAVEYLGMIPCAATGSLVVDRGEDGSIQYLSCYVCERSTIQSVPISIKESHLESEAACRDTIEVFDALVKSEPWDQSRRPRVLGMLSLRRLCSHYREPSFMDLEKSFLGEWCLKSLTSSLRELRVTAGHTLLGFLQGPSTDQDLIKRNRVRAIGLLKTISEQNVVTLQETCIMAWGQVGRSLNDEELNLVLNHLVDYLGHKNPIISGAAFNEIMNLAKTLGVTVQHMLTPFWSTVAVVAIKDLLVKPQKPQLLADLLGITVQKLLDLTQYYTLPYLVKTKQVDVIRKIAFAVHKDEDFPVCLGPNAVPILASLLTHSTSDMETHILSLLRPTSSRIEKTSFMDLIMAQPSSLALHLLKTIGDSEDSKKSRNRLALTLLAKYTPYSEKASKPVAAFLEQHVLGLVGQLAEGVNDVRTEQSVSEKRRCVKAIEEMIRLGKASTRAARPQISSCLQSALAQKDLQAVGFSAWQTMLTNLNDEDVGLMLESTFSIIIQRWESFDEATRKRAESTLQYLLKDRDSIVESMVLRLPSLAALPELSDVEKQLKRLRRPVNAGIAFTNFSQRLKHESSGVVAQALSELKARLKGDSSFLQASAVSEQPDVVIALLVRSILDACVKFNQSHPDIAQLSAECIGLIGCLDPNRVESVRAQREVVVVSNFLDIGETTEFVMFVLEEVIVKAFLSSTDTNAQGFLSYVMQVLLEQVEIKAVCVPLLMSGNNESQHPLWLRWKALPPGVQDTLTPFLTSMYAIKEVSGRVQAEYPLFRPETTRSEKLYSSWLRLFVMDLLQKPQNAMASLIFEPLRRAIRIRDSSIASFLLPYLVLHVVAGGTDQNRQDITNELLAVLQYQITPESSIRGEDLRICSEAVFRVLDYFSRWMQEAQRSDCQFKDDVAIKNVQTVLKMLPAEIISQRAVECKSYSRALFYWERHIRELRQRHGPLSEPPRGLMYRLQDIYTQIDEPDGIEGISAYVDILDIDQQILGHRKAGRWTAAQSWYEIKLAEDPDNVDTQVNLLDCLKESGQHDILLNYVEGMHTSSKTVAKLLPFAAEASWATGRWVALEKYTTLVSKDSEVDFNVSIGDALLSLHKQDKDRFTSAIQSIRAKLASSMSIASTSSFGACHDTMLKLHVLTELEMITGTTNTEDSRYRVLDSLERRLEVVGAYLGDKQYLLGIRRAAMQLSSRAFTKKDIASAWLTSARLARKGNSIHQSFNAVLHATKLGDETAIIEHARLLWKEGHHRKAINSLDRAIDDGAFISHNVNEDGDVFESLVPSEEQNYLTARAHLLLAKWLDSAGQTQSATVRKQYQLAVKTCVQWEKGHYYLGRHYNKLLESERALAPEQQNEQFLTGENAKLVIENYLRALSFGTKYLYQTLPRIITLWLDLGTIVNQPLDPKYGKEFVTRITEGRRASLAQIHERFKKYTVRTPTYIFYTALSQIIARIAHPNKDVYSILKDIVHRVVSSYPQHSLWSLIAVSTSLQSDKKTRGIEIMQALRKSAQNQDMRAMMKTGERLSAELVMACSAGDFSGNRTAFKSLTKDIGFNLNSCTPNPLAVPIESVLTATLPTLTDDLKTHKAFSRDVITITTFQDQVMVLNSLQRPRKLTAIGSDGKQYGLMCKPKDDLRKDQRLMEFNSMINRSLKRDAESSKRRLYIKTYAVTPLNEDCGLIEWVDGLKTLRDILFDIYRPMGITPNWSELSLYCGERITDLSKVPLFTETVLKKWPSVFHLWFVQQFPEPSAWFAARLRYTRSCAVMSMVGTILGLGDRHGENILFEKGNGGTFHVDFNCLFDKGRTFATPERVPFRLTHNMVDAMGIYGYEGPFRKSSELTLSLLRQHEETLMTILEAFIYDPTLDLLNSTKKEKRRKEGAFHVANDPQGVLKTIQRKVRGLLDRESVPLGVEGQVDVLIKEATNLYNLGSMYVGWCAFL